MREDTLFRKELPANPDPYVGTQPTTLELWKTVAQWMPACQTAEEAARRGIELWKACQEETTPDLIQERTALMMEYFNELYGKLDANGKVPLSVFIKRGGSKDTPRMNRFKEFLRAYIIHLKAQEGETIDELQRSVAEVGKEEATDEEFEEAMTSVRNGIALPDLMPMWVRWRVWLANHGERQIADKNRCGESIRRFMKI